MAFTYGYAFELPSREISDLQETHAQACEHAGLANCRITGLTYTVDRDGQASASLSVKVAAGIARRFGRDAIWSADKIGATLVGAEITGEDMQPAIAEARAEERTAGADAADLERRLRDPRLPAAERQGLEERRAARAEAERSQAAAARAQAARLADTPMAFSYQAGRGVGFGNALRDSADAALSSTRTTLIWAIWLLATLGPPGIALLLIWLVWRRWGRQRWERLIGPAE
ncbi:MAG TPA: hypothetical protein VF649_03815 [Sphingomonas sp.]